MTHRPEIVAIGNALVDVLAPTDEAFLADRALPKGGMRLIDTDEAERLYQEMGPAIEASGGSAANTVAGVAGLGVGAAYIGRVADDQLGAVFAHDLRAIGVAFDTPPATDGVPTGRCLILVTPDGQRTMNTYLGASAGLSAADLDLGQIAAARVLYLEGYLFDRAEAKHAYQVAAETARAAGVAVALTLSDTFCVHRHHADFVGLVERQVDILFANEAEILALSGAASFEQALAWVRGRVRLACLTRSEKGSVLATADGVVEVAAAPVARVVDTTGAGDLYAAGVLAGRVRGRDLATCGRMGALAAAAVLGQMGPRPQTDLRAMMDAALV